MKPIYQRQRGDCVVACVASLSDKPWKTVKAAVGNTRHGCDRTQTRHLLDTFCGEHVYSTPHSPYTQFEWAETHRSDLALLIIRASPASTDKFDHAVVSHYGSIHDPLREPFGPSQVIEVYRLKDI